MFVFRDFWVLQEDVSSSYLQKTVSIAESTEEIIPEEEVAGPSARDKVLAAAPSYSTNGASKNGSVSSSDDEDRHLPSFDSHKQKSDKGRDPKNRPAFQSMDIQGDSDSS